MTGFRFRACIAVAFWVASICAAPAIAQNAPTRCEVLVYGGSSAGVTAAVEAARLGKTVVLIAPNGHLGGLSSAGLGWTDMGRPEIVGGLSREFYERIFTAYQQPRRWVYSKREQFAGAPGQHTRAVDPDTRVQWVFEPHVAEEVFENLARDVGVTVVRNERLDRGSGVEKEGTRIELLRLEGGRSYAARVFIDATYEGDLLAEAGVDFVIGREANAEFGESRNGIQSARATKNQLPKGINAYVRPGDASSGLLPGVNADPGGEDGAGDDRIQAYCYRMCLTDEPRNRIAVTKPQGYDERDYELLFRAIEAGQTDRFFKTDRMPNGKTDSNNASGISTDGIGLNYAYPQATYAERDEIAEKQRRWQAGLIWTLQHHPRVPEVMRKKYAAWGLTRDEFTKTGGWPHELYVREARRMRGEAIATEHTLLDDSTVSRPIGLGGYAMDSHNVQRYADSDGNVRNEGDVQIALQKPYAIDYGVICPRQEQCDNLLVPVCVSASHIAFGSIRMEPVFMTLGQSAGAAAVIAIDSDKSVQDIDYEKLNHQLRGDGVPLRWPIQKETEDDQPR